uniref:RING-type domain-containing protein n=1 Tax=Parastrongyloides trichosuri TaxID=131310 RepID=A0A0N4ZIK6_PARTI
MDSSLLEKKDKKKRYRKRNKNKESQKEPTEDELLKIVENAERKENEERIRRDERIARRLAQERTKNDVLTNQGPQLFDYLKVASHITDRSRKSSKNSNDTKIILNLSDLPTTNCLICTEEAKKPVGCLHCLQFLGCKNCVKKWEKTTNLEGNDDGLRNLFQSNENHQSCFLCRAKWNSKFEEFCYYE